MTISVNKHFNKLTPIGYRYDSDVKKEGFAGTGFFYQSQYTATLPEILNDADPPPMGPYLVTNRHIVKPKDEPSPDRLAIYIREDGFSTRPTRYDLPLYDSEGEPLWFEHPNKDVDVVLILLDLELNPRYTYKRVQIADSGNEVSGGDMARVIGYPNLLREFRMFPIMRDGLVSSPYGVSFEDEEFFYFDARLHQGMSGSPVVYIPPETIPIDDAVLYDSDSEGPPEPVKDMDIEIDSINMPNTQEYLLGIHSDERIETDEDTTIEEMRERLEKLEEGGEDEFIKKLESVVEQLSGETGLNVAWHASLIEEIREEGGVTDEDAVTPI